MKRFANKIAVVTGSSGGIGGSICTELMKHNVIVVGLDKGYEKSHVRQKDVSTHKKFEGKFHPVFCDVTKEDEVRSSFQWILSKLGPVSILVNGAGTAPWGPLTETNSEQISQIFDTNVKASILCSKEAVKIMQEKSIAGHVININSILGQYIPGAYTMVNLYVSSKHALRVISEGLRRELALTNSNIKVSNISPGRVKTSMTKFFPICQPLIDELTPADIAEACICVLNTPPHVVISELTVVPIRQQMYE